MMWPTPRNCTAMTRENIQNRVNDKFPNLESVVARSMWPTPTRVCHKGSHKDRGKYNLTEHVGGSLNPTWVEWLMGYPSGWTDLEDSETP